MGSFVEMTSEQFRAALLQGKTPYVKPELFPKKSKYNNEKTERDGFVYDSKKEANRGDILNELQKNGKIMSLERQKPFILIEPFDYRGTHIRGTKWVADFYYYDCVAKEWVAEDVKSWMTKKKPEYVIKKKLFMKKYPDIVFKEFI